MPRPRPRDEMRHPDAQAPGGVVCPRAAPGSLPRLQADQRILHPGLVVLDHVLVHVGVVLPDVPLRAPVGHGSKAERWGVRIRVLELRGDKIENKNNKKRIEEREKEKGREGQREE